MGSGDTVSLNISQSFIRWLVGGGLVVIIGGTTAVVTWKVSHENDFVVLEEKVGTNTKKMTEVEALTIALGDWRTEETAIEKGMMEALGVICTDPGTRKLNASDCARSDIYLSQRD